jgi:hypothetical protein
MQAAHGARIGQAACAVPEAVIRASLDHFFYSFILDAARASCATQTRAA